MRNFIPSNDVTIKLIKNTKDIFITCLVVETNGLAKKKNNVLYFSIKIRNLNLLLKSK